MPDSTSTEALRFFVYIIESPSAPDIYHGRSEGGLVARALELNRIPCVTRTVINQIAFQAAIRIGLPEVMKQFPDLLPIIHVSAHGASHGIQLSDGTELLWCDLKELLVPVNQSLKGYLLLCMSACEGYNACQMAMEKEDGPLPYYAMVGNCGKPTWADTAIAYSAFYHLLGKGRKVADAVPVMRAASGDDRWIHETAEEAKRGFIEYLQSVKPTEAQVALEAAAQDSPPPPEAKALEAKG